MRTIDNINDLNKSDFLSIFGNVFEKTESVAVEAFESKPFKNFEDIMFKMLDIYDFRIETEKVAKNIDKNNKYLSFISSWFDMAWVRSQ